MATALCALCIGAGYCRKRNAKLVTDNELENPNFRYDVRMTAAALTNALGLTRDRWLDFISDLYRDYGGRILDAGGGEVFLDMEALEISPYWYRDNCMRAPGDEAGLRLREESRERWRIIATILRASFPERAFTWGMRPANDNEKR